MKPATLVQIRKELETISPQRLMALTLRLIKLKSENKEFVSYLLFDEDQLSEYLADLKFEISEVLDCASFSQSLIAKKALRKCQKSITKHARYMGSKDAEAELYMFMIRKIHEKGINKYTHRTIQIIYLRCIERVKKLLPNIHDDLRGDFEIEIQNLLKY